MYESGETPERQDVYKAIMYCTKCINSACIKMSDTQHNSILICMLANRNNVLVTDSIYLY
jgi:hypothetical protein